MTLAPFHLALPVADLGATRAFYQDVLGAGVGRSAPRWIDIDLFGHQLSFHLLPDARPPEGHNPVDGDAVPIPHFGVVLAWDDWHALVERLEALGIAFVIGPRTRFAGEPGEQATCFLRDPDGYALEFKSFKDPTRLFAT